LKTETFYRLELAFDGVPQNVGFFAGIDEVGLPSKTELQILDAFHELECPDLAGHKVSFWFTSSGYKKYAKPLQEAKEVLKAYNWQVLLAQMCFSRDFALWSDEYQAAFEEGRLPIVPREVLL